MPHSHHGKSHSPKQKRPRSYQHRSKGKEEKPRQVAEDAVKGRPITGDSVPNVQPLAEQSRPWSPWIPGGDGRWFYQGRLKADGSGWEYQFTEGYPLASRQRGPKPYPIVSSPYHPVPTQTRPHNPVMVVPAVIPVTNQPPIQVMSAGDNTEEIDGDDGEADMNINEAPIAEITNVPIQMAAQQPQAFILAHATRLPAATKIPSASQALVRHMAGRGGKKLSSIVKADKERRINSRKRVKSWLSEVDP